LNFADAAAPTYFRSCGKTSPPEFACSVFWRFSASLVGDHHPQEDLAKTFLQLKAAISFCDEFSFAIWRQQFSKTNYVENFLCSKLNCQKSKKTFA
jgi:hypothetical protein